jgi:glycosyltransferase involved in cell wall biosynthesis
MTPSPAIKPAVSIAICTYNGARFLKQQLDSILSQTYQNITEIVCVDDNSSDETVKILKEYQAADHRIKVYENSSNLGYIKNFEKVLTLCHEEYIALSDQDDLWYPFKIERLMNAIGDNLMVYSDTEYIDGNNNKLGKKMSDFRHLGSCHSCLNLVLFNGISGHTMIIRKELLHMAVPFSLYIPHDYWLAFYAAKQGQIAFVDEVLVGYRQHTQNALGGIGVGAKQNNRLTDTYMRLDNFEHALADSFEKEKEIIAQLKDKYIDLTFKKRIQKVCLFYKYRNDLLFFKRKNKIGRILYCLQIFWRII